MRILPHYVGLAKILVVLFFLSACAQANNGKVIAVKNSLDFDRLELVSISYESFLKLKDAHTASFKIVNQESKEEYPYQIEMLGQDTPQNILIQVFVPALSEVKLVVEAGQASAISSKTYARYVPERLDDFAWENNVVAFRMYGEALEGRNNDAQGMDIWVKRTNDLVIDRWYKSDDYHKDYGEGLDYYSVGQTLGAGDIAGYSNGTIYYSKHYRTYDILDNGPLRSTFILNFEPWEVDGTKVNVSKTISIDAGTQLNRIVLDFDIDNAEEVIIAAGIARRKEPGQVIDKHQEGIFGYWEPEHGDDGITGIGMIFNQPIDSVDYTDTQYLSLFQAKAGVPTEYYVGGAWNKAGRITNVNEWLVYLEQQKRALANPLEIKIN